MLTLEIRSGFQGCGFIGQQPIDNDTFPCDIFLLIDTIEQIYNFFQYYIINLVYEIKKLNEKSFAKYPWQKQQCQTSRAGLAIYCLDNQFNTILPKHPKLMGCQMSVEELSEKKVTIKHEKNLEREIISKVSKKYEPRKIEHKEKTGLVFDYYENVKKGPNKFTGKDLFLIQGSLQKHFLLYKQDQGQRNQLIDYMTCYTAQKGTYIIQKGDPAHIFFIISEGTVRMEVDSTQLKVLNRGDTIGDQSIIYETQRSASYYDVTDCKLWGVTKTIFKNALKKLIQKNFKQTCRILKGVSLFKNFQESKRNLIASKMHTLKYDQKAFIFMRGEVANAFFIVIKGEVGLNVPGKQIIVLRSGDSFGQSALNVRVKRSGDAVCLENALLLSISRSSINDCLGGNFDSIVHSSVIKWSLRRSPVFKVLSNMTIDKIIAEGKIKKFEDGDVICPKGEKEPNTLICLEGKINGEGIGTIFNQNFDTSSPQIIQEPLIKQEKGAVFAIPFHKLNYIVGNILNVRREKQENIMFLSGLLDKQYMKLELANLIFIAPISQGQNDRKYVVYDSAITKRFFFIKIYRKNLIVKNGIQKSIVEEKKNWQQLDRHYVTKLHATFKDKSFIYFVYNYEQHGDFRNALNLMRKYSRSYARFYLGCLILCLQQLHSHNIVHRDLQPDHLLLDTSGYLVIGSISRAKKLKDSKDRTYTKIGTSQYLAPEVLGGKGYGFSVDYWSMGIILYEMLCGFRPFKQNLTSYEIYSQIMKKDKITFPHYYTQETGKQITYHLLNKDPQKRTSLSLQQIKGMEFFDEFDWDGLKNRLIDSPFICRTENYTELKYHMKTPIQDHLRQNNIREIGTPLQSHMYPNWEQQF